MEFERLVSSLDAEGFSRAAEALLRLLSGGAAERASALSDPASWRGSRTGVPLPYSAAGAAGPLPGAEGGRREAAAAESLFSSVPGGAAGTARGEQRPDLIAERKPRAPGAEAAEELARLEERLAAVSERNRRAFGADAETVPPFHSAPDPAVTGAAAAGAGQVPALSAARAGGFDAAAVPGEAEAAPAHRASGAAARDFFDAEAVSEFFRRDSRRYDSGFSD